VRWPLSSGRPGGKFVSRKTGIVRTQLGRPGAEKEMLEAASTELGQGHRHRVGTVHRLKREIGGHAAN